MQRPIVDYASPRASRPSPVRVYLRAIRRRWVRLLDLTIALSLIHLWLTICCGLGSLRPEWAARVVGFPVHPLISALPWDLDSISTPASIALGIANSLLNGFCIAFVITRVRSRLVRTSRRGRG
jgi:hypothetical protein